MKLHLMVNMSAQKHTYLVCHDGQQSSQLNRNIIGELTKIKGLGVLSTRCPFDGHDQESTAQLCDTGPSAHSE